MESNPVQQIITEPIIFIVGSTASGKTKLSLELAQKYKEIEIINADAIQLYKGADIMTAKATPEERNIVTHHLLDILPLEKLDFTRKDYFALASQLIKDLHQQNKIPLIVGGTNYYIESLLYTGTELTDTGNDDLTEINEMYQTVVEKLKEQPENSLPADAQENKGKFAVPNGWEGLSSIEKHQILATIDPLMGQKIHPNDTKRVENYIKVYLDEGIQPSKKLMMIDQQKKLRFEHCLVLWVKDKDKEKLSERIKKRIREMVDIKGVQEIIEVYENLDSKGPLDFQRGVLQSIGYKEFYDFYKKTKGIAHKQGLNNVSAILQNVNNVENLDQELKEVLEECIKKLITATEHYAKRQITWIKNRIAADPKVQDKLLLLEFSDASKFNEQVVSIGLQALNDFLQGKSLYKEEKESDKRKANPEKYENWKRHFCEACDVTLNGEDQWQSHIKSKKHKKIKEKKAKHQRNMEMKIKYDKEKEKQQLQTKPEST